MIIFIIINDHLLDSHSCFTFLLIFILKLTLLKGIFNYFDLIVALKSCRFIFIALLCILTFFTFCIIFIRYYVLTFLKYAQIIIDTVLVGRTQVPWTKWRKCSRLFIHLCINSRSLSLNENNSLTITPMASTVANEAFLSLFFSFILRFS